MPDASGYRPANSAEGATFMARWCGRCVRDADGHCPIAINTMAFRLSDPEYPHEWRTTAASGPFCTEFDPLDPADQPFDPAAAIGLLL